MPLHSPKMLYLVQEREVEVERLNVQSHGAENAVEVVVELVADI